MARRQSFSTHVANMARAQARIQKLKEMERRKEQTRREKLAREQERLKAQADKDAKQRYLASRSEEVEDLNRALNTQIEQLRGILEHTFSIDDTISFKSLLLQEQYPEFSPPGELTTPHKKPVQEEFFQGIEAPSGIKQLIPGAYERYQRDFREAKEKYLAAWNKGKEQEEQRLVKLNQLKEEYEAGKRAFIAKVEQNSQEVEEFETAYQDGDPNAIVAYSTMVLERSEYPEGFPQEFRVGYAPDPKELIVEYELPDVSLVPTVSEYRYIKTKDAIEEKACKPAEIKEIYQEIVASVCLRTVHEVLEADQGQHIQVVVFNGFVQAVDRSTGRDVRPCLISIRVTRPKFLELDLRRIDKRACLRNLGAQVSSQAAEMIPVKPIVEFDMVDKRFVEQSDVLADLESRPNLMELSPFEFENLVSNLFDRMGLQTRQTRSSKDGGVDAVAFDPRPILGGKVIIQAKRYKNPVGVSAVRDLYGTMMNEGANKGILVATSHYGTDAYEFSKDKPIELIDGGGLLYLLEQVGVQARIVFPES